MGTYQKKHQTANLRKVFSLKCRTAARRIRSDRYAMLGYVRMKLIGLIEYSELKDFGLEDSELGDSGLEMINWIIWCEKEYIDVECHESILLQNTSILTGHAE